MHGPDIKYGLLDDAKRNHLRDKLLEKRKVIIAIIRKCSLLEVTDAWNEQVSKTSLLQSQYVLGQLPYCLLYYLSFYLSTYA